MTLRAGILLRCMDNEAPRNLFRTTKGYISSGFYFTSIELIPL